MTYDTAMSLLNLSGLIITAIGALIAARALTITDEQAAELSKTSSGESRFQKTNLKAQSESIRTGVYFVFAGSLLQAASIAIPLLYAPAG